MSKARIVHLTLAKCGSQWVRDVLCAPEIVNFSGMTHSGSAYNLPSTGELDMPRGMFSGPIFGMSQLEWHGFKSQGDKALVVLRDPRDRMISLMYSLLYSHSTSSQGDSYIDYMRSQLLDMKSDGVRIVRMIGEVKFWMRFYLTWTSDEADDAYVVRYEALIQNQRTEFRKIINWLGWQVPDEILGSVIDRLSFKARSGRNPGELDISSHHRRGVAGDWRNYFTSEHGRLWEQLYPEFLTLIGYEKSNAWWKSLPRGTREPESLQIDSLEMLTNRNRDLEREMIEKEREIHKLAQICSERLDLINQQSAQLIGIAR